MLKLTYNRATRKLSKEENFNKSSKAGVHIASTNGDADFDYKIEDTIILVPYDKFGGDADDSNTPIKKSDIKHQKKLSSFKGDNSNSKTTRGKVYEWVNEMQEKDKTEYMALLWSKTDKQYLEF